MQETSFSFWLEGSIIYYMKHHQTWDSMWGANFKSQRNHLPHLRQDQHYLNYYKLINDAGFKRHQLQKWNLSLVWYSLQYLHLRGGKLFSPCNNPDGRIGDWQTLSILRQKLVTYLPWFSTSKENRSQKLQNVFIRDLESTTICLALYFNNSF